MLALGVKEKRKKGACLNSSLDRGPVVRMPPRKDRGLFVEATSFGSTYRVIDKDPKTFGLGPAVN